MKNDDGMSFLILVAATLGSMLLVCLEAFGYPTFIHAYIDPWLP